MDSGEIGIQDLVLSVEAEPGSPAVTSGATTLTYEELKHRSAFLASMVRSRGLGREDIVALHVPRSAEQAVAILGVLRAGCAFLPLLTTDPVSYNAELVRRSAARALVHAGHLPRPVRSAAPTTIDVSQLDRPAVPPNPAAGPGESIRVHGSALAYLVYTSGSTGQPRGVLVPHNGVVNYLRQLRTRDGMPRRGTSLQCAPLSFDAAVRDLVFPLTAGHHVIIPTPEERADPWRLLRLLVNRAVNVLPSAVPSLLADLVDAAQARGEVAPAVSLIMYSGDFLTDALRDRVRTVFPNARIVNQYGLTEGTMTATAADLCVPGESTVDSGNQVGRAIPGVSVSVVDDALRPLGTGEVGEICIRGAGVTRGYHGDPAATAVSFVADPSIPGARMLRTGDLGRLLSDGRLELLGRVDRRVKVRGARVDLATPELVLGALPSVAEVAVVAVGEDESRTLAAFVVAATGAAPPTPDDLRSALADRLPHAMVPSIVHVVDELPRTTTGKLDRRALLNTARSGGEEPVSEAAVVAMWAEVLGCSTEDVAAGDFFSLGGESIAATRILAQCRTRFGIEASVREVLLNPTAAGFAETLIHLGEDQRRPGHALGTAPA